MEPEAIMNLFLASQASETLDLLVPYLVDKPQNMRLIFVSTAGNVYNETPWILRDKTKLLELGFIIDEIDISKFSKSELYSRMNDADIVFVAGGNTSYLLEQANKSGFSELVKELIHNGVWYVGSSAGTVIAGPNLEYDQLYDEGEFGRTLNSYEGFHFVEFIPVPHGDSQEHQPYIKKALDQYSDRFDMKVITDKQAYLVQGAQVKLVTK